MKHKSVYRKNQNQVSILPAFNQPLTAKQLSLKTGIPADTCGYLLSKLAKNNLVNCLNPSAGSSRLYWLTKSGRHRQKDICKKMSLPYKEYSLPDIDWALYGRICFNQRCAVIKTLTEPMQPARIKQVLRLQRPNIKISANNIRDVIRFLSSEKIVQPVKIKKKAHPRYELTESGHIFRRLLITSMSHIGQNSSNHI